MPVAFVLINTEIAKERDVLKALKALKAVSEAHIVWGVYDIIAKVEADTVEELKKVVSTRIRRLDGVRSTMTMMVTE